MFFLCVGVSLVQKNVFSVCRCKLSIKKCIFLCVGVSLVYKNVFSVCKLII